METQRPSPEELLYHIHQQQDQSTHGKLKIFFGYAAGVGKTYTMLEAAHQAQKEGRDVVVGYVERHVRPETLALLDGLEQMPCKEVPYKGVMLKEFDLDEALARKPQLILVDELAHSNAPGCRHAKRYQDVEELLRAGIDVYTTVTSSIWNPSMIWWRRLPGYRSANGFPTAFLIPQTRWSWWISNRRI